MQLWEEGEGGGRREGRKFQRSDGRRGRMEGRKDSSSAVMGGGGRREGGKFQCSDGRRGRREGREGRGSRLVDERTKIRWQGKEVRGRQEAALEKR